LTVYHPTSLVTNADDKRNGNVQNTKAKKLKICFKIVCRYRATILESQLSDFIKKLTIKRKVRLIGTLMLIIYWQFMVRLAN
jgi:hypothetical protein